MYASAEAGRLPVRHGDPLSVRPLTTLAAALAAFALTSVPLVAADHIGAMRASQSSVGLNHEVTITVTFIPTGQCCGGLFEWTTGDGASGAVDDGIYGGTYGGDASGSGSLSDSRTFTWRRIQDTGTSQIRIDITYPYHAAGTYTVTWHDCCPDASGSFTAVAL